MNKVHYLPIVAITLLVIVLSIGCDSDSATTATPPGTTQDITTYLPLKEGNTWTYDVFVYGTSSENKIIRTDTVSGTKDINGTAYQVFKRTSDDRPDYETQFYFNDNNSTTVNFYGEEMFENGTGIHSLTYDEPFPVYQYPFNEGDTWTIYEEEGVPPTEGPYFLMQDFFPTDDVDGDDIPDTLDITIVTKVKGTETITVDAGTFEDCILIEREARFLLHYSAYPAFEYTGLEHIWFKPHVGVVQSHFYLFGSNFGYEELVTLISYTAN